MTLYAMLRWPIGRIRGWAIPEHISQHIPMRAAIGLELRNAWLNAEHMERLKTASELNNTVPRVEPT